MSKHEIDNAMIDEEDFESEGDVEDTVKAAPVLKDMRRRLEDKLDEVRLGRILKEYDFKDI